jgi:hypothetical protein
MRHERERERELYIKERRRKAWKKGEQKEE